MKWLLGLFILVGPINCLGDNCTRLAYLRPFFNKSSVSRIFLQRWVREKAKSLEIFNPCNFDTEKVIEGIETWKVKLDNHIWKRWMHADRSPYLNLNLNETADQLDYIFTEIEQNMPVFVEQGKETAMSILQEFQPLDLFSVEEFGRLPRDERLDIVQGIVCYPTWHPNNLIYSTNNLTMIDQSQSDRLKIVLMTKIHNFKFPAKERISYLLTRIRNIFKDNIDIFENINAAINKLGRGDFPQMEQFIYSLLEEMKSGGLSGLKNDYCNRFQQQIGEVMNGILWGIDHHAKMLHITDDRTHLLDFDKTVKYIEDNLDLDDVVDNAIYPFLDPLYWLLDKIEYPDRQGQEYPDGQGQGYPDGQGQEYPGGQGPAQEYPYGQGPGQEYPYRQGPGQDYHYGQGPGQEYPYGQGPGQEYPYGQGPGQEYPYGQGPGQDYPDGPGQGQVYPNKMTQGPIPGIFQYKFLKEDAYFLRDSFGMTKLGDGMVDSIVLRIIVLTAGGSYFGLW